MSSTHAEDMMRSFLFVHLPAITLGKITANNRLETTKMATAGSEYVNLYCCCCWCQPEKYTFVIHASDLTEAEG